MSASAPATMIVLSAADVAALLDLDELVDALAVAMVDLSTGRASAPPRVAAQTVSPPGLLAAMPAYLPSASALTTKLVTQFPGNRDRPTHQAIICCFDPREGTPLALIDGDHLTAARTAAGSALATRLLARPGAREVAVVGTGVQAISHAHALIRLPGIEVVRIAGRNPDKVAYVVRELGGFAEAADSIEAAVRSADIVCAATHTDAPVLQRDWLRPGAHVNSVGYNTTGTGEVDPATVAAAVVVVEQRDAALRPPPAGAVELADLDPAAVVEIGELVADPALVDREALTLYKSVGVAVQDAAAAALVLRAAAERGLGTRITI
ncbi:MAG: ornithine cyclodeaminase family protein [Jatrophihabitantaceae bacterium]